MIFKTNHYFCVAPPLHGQRPLLDLSQCFKTRLLPLTGTGLGHAGSVKKTANACGVYMSESADQAQFDTVRKEVRGFCTDQGAERGICDETARILPGFVGESFANKNAWLWPRALWVPGMLHLLFNALEESCKKLDVAERFFVALASVFAVFGELDVRRKFQNDCCETRQEKAAFETGGRHHVDWRWEFMGPALEWVLDHWDMIVLRWDLAKMLLSESGALTRKAFHEVSAIIKDWPQFPLLAEMFLAAGRLMEWWAGALEGCECHKAVWTKKRRWEKILDEIQASTGYRHCVWKGRQGAWFVAVGHKRLIDQAMSFTSVGLEARLRQCVDAASRQNALRWVDSLRNCLAETLRNKLFFWTHVPWKILGVFHAELGGSLATCKRILGECIVEFDAAVAGGREAALHRVAVRILSKATPSGAQLRQWLLDDTGRPLRDYPEAWLMVLEYALVTLVERRVESIHAVIKRFLRKLTFITVPQLCAEIRFHDTMKMLVTEVPFRRFVLENWRSRRLMPSLLSQRVSPAELSAMNMGEKTKTVYQCTFACEFEDTLEARVQSAHFSDALALVVASPPRQPVDAQAVIDFLKALFRSQVFYSFPQNLFQAWRLASQDDEQALQGAFSRQVLDAADVGLPEPDGPQTIFQVMNARVSARFATPVPHVMRSRSMITVGECLQVAWREPLRDQLVCHRSMGQPEIKFIQTQTTLRNCENQNMKKLLFSKILLQKGFVIYETHMFVILHCFEGHQRSPSI